MTKELSQTALLVMDMQNAIVSRYVSEESALLPFQKAIMTARENGIPVIYVGVAMREGVQISPLNKMFGRMPGNSGITAEHPSMQIHAALSPLPDEPFVGKYRVSAFSGSELENLLRSRGIDRLILSGIATSGVVLSTVREAADKDYGLTVLSDACIDSDPEVHRVLTGKVFPAQADVLTVEDWANTLK